MVVVDICHDSAAERVVLKVVDNSVNLVEHTFLVLVLNAELIAVSLADRAVLVSPGIPNVGVQIVNIV